MTSTTKLRDGTRLVYDIHGRDDGRPRLVLIHSLGMDRFFWERVIPIVANDAAILTYDCRGHGASDKPKGPYRVEKFADDLAELMDHLRWPSAIVAGASMGGCITLAFAARAATATSAGLAAMIDFQVTRWFTDGFRASHSDLVKRNVDRFLANDPAAYAETCRMLGACNLESALPRMKVPAAIVGGAEYY